ncbi:bidirectional sugar transporter SWEET2a-like isoform X2 [Elaeis guineensis]
MWYGLPFVSYGVILVATVNSIGAVCQLVYVTLFIIYADTTRRLKMSGLLIAVLCVFSLIIYVSLELFDHQSRQTFVGYLSVASLISMFASPLFIINLVIRTRSVEFMPFCLSLATFLMSVSFFAYGLLLHDFSYMFQMGLEQSWESYNCCYMHTIAGNQVKNLGFHCLGHMDDSALKKVECTKHCFFVILS